MTGSSTDRPVLASPARNPGFRWWIATVVAAVGCGVLAWRFSPAPPNPLTLEITPAAARRGESEPLVTSGRNGEGDFLYVRWHDQDTAVFGYDSWGRNGPESRPVRFAPRTAHRVEIRMPSLNQIYSYRAFEPDHRLQVIVDGATVIDEDVSHYVRSPSALWLGENPIGGSSAGPRFAGEIRHDGRRWHGRIDSLFTLGERLQLWLTTSPLQWSAVLLLAVLVAACWSSGQLSHAAAETLPRMREHKAAVVVCAIAALSFVAILTGGSFRLIYPDGFGSFFDFQAASFLHGRLDVPAEAIGNEAFIYHGRYYGYFGATPALLRVPFVLFDAEFGRMTRLFMTAEFAAAMVAAYLLLRCATRLVRGNAAQPGTAVTVLFLSNVGLGSTLFFLGSRAYVYHEAILCGATFALWSVWCSMRYLELPSRRWWLGSLVCGVLAVHARPPSGLFALSVLATIALVLAWRGKLEPRLPPVAIAAAAMSGVFSFNALSFAKFHTFDGSPLRLNVQYDAKRLARIDGRNFHLSNLRFNSYTYLIRPNLNLSARFPWAALGRSKPGTLFPEAKSDYADSTLAFPFAMPVLFWLGTAGSLIAWRLAGMATARIAVSGLWVGIGPMALAMFTAIATVHRYTADFCPFLIALAAFGFAALNRLGRRTRLAVTTVVALVTLWSVVITACLTLRYEGTLIWGVPDDVVARYRALCAAVDQWFGAQ